jgi:hypothetical protein
MWQCQYSAIMLLRYPWTSTNLLGALFSSTDTWICACCDSRSRSNEQKRRQHEKYSTSIAHHGCIRISSSLLYFSLISSGWRIQVGKRATSRFQKMMVFPFNAQSGERASEVRHILDSTRSTQHFGSRPILLYLVPVWRTYQVETPSSATRPLLHAVYVWRSTFEHCSRIHTVSPILSLSFWTAQPVESYQKQ